MTSTPPPARHQLWHPTRGISFSPSLRVYKSPLQEPLIFTRTAATTTGQTAEPTAEPIVETQYVSFSEAQDAQPSTLEAGGPEGDALVNGRRVLSGNDGETIEADQTTVDFGPPPATTDFKIAKDLFYAAKKAPSGSPESYWSYTQYRGPLEDGKPRKVKVHYCRSKHTMESVCQNYFMNEKVLGFDLEWVTNVTRHDDIRKNVSLIQLASPSRIALFHVAVFDGKSGFVAPSFKKIMEDPDITKVGVAIKGDATRVRNFMNVDSRGLLELSHLYKLVIYSNNRQYENINKRLVPLATQVQQFLRLPLFKGHDVRGSDWSKPLNMDQVVYSASDAYAGLHLFTTLEHYREQLDPCPPTPRHAELNLPIQLAKGIELETDDEATDISDDAPPDPTPHSDYIASVLESIRIEDLDSSKEKQKKKSPSKRGRSKPPPKEKPPPKPKHPFVEAAEDRAMVYRDTHPSARVTPSVLRAYYLWYNHDLDPKAIASMVREPPLQTSTIINYILTSIQFEKLPYNQERLLSELAYPLPYNLRSRWSVAVEAVKKAEAKKGV